MMNRLFILFLVIPLLFSSCANNSGVNPVIPPVVDPEIPPAPEGEIKLKLSNESLSSPGLNGWEQFRFDKKITMLKTTEAIKPTATRRYVEFDGFTSYFFEDGSFYEKNPNNVVYLEGKYKVLNESQLELTYRFKNAKEDSTVVHTVNRITNMRLHTRFQYITPSTSKYDLEAVDTRQFRNLLTMADQHPEIAKVKITQEKLKGTWRLDSYKKWEDDFQETTPDYAGTLNVFDGAGSYKAIATNGVISEQGRYAIVDDVIHLFYKDTNEAGELVDMASTYWIKKWVEGDTEKIYIFDEIMTAIKGKESKGVIFLKTETWMSKVK